MNLVKVIVSLALVVLTAFGWMSVGKETISAPSEYSSYVQRGDRSFEQKLYEDAYEKYTAALSIKSSSKVLEKQVEAYTAFYEEEKSGDSATRQKLISVLDAARKQEEHNTDYAKAEIELYLERSDYQNAKRVCGEAYASNQKDEELQKYWEEIIQVTSLGYEYYPHYREQVSKGFLVADGVNSWLLDDAGSVSSDKSFVMMGDHGTEGYFLGQKLEQQVRIYDEKGVARGVTDDTYMDAGCYADGLCPVQKGVNEWYYLNLKGEQVLGPYQDASSFIDGKAAVQIDGSWAIIEKDGSAVSDAKFDDIKLGLERMWMCDDVMIAAQEHGKYQLFSGSLKAISEEYYEDADIPTEDGMYAVQKSGKWGFVNKKGEVVSEPQYQKAKSFRNGLAAVQASSGKWGFVKKNQEPVMEYQFMDAGYVTPSGTVMVSDEHEMYRILSFLFFEELVK